MKPKRSFLSRCLMVALTALFLTNVRSHNLDQQDTRISFDADTLALMSSRAGLGQPLLQAGDTVGVVLKSTPGPGTLTGAGGYLTFYIPPGTQVMNAEYGAVDSTGTFLARPMKGPSIIAMGDGPIGSASTAALIGLNLGPNIVGTTAPTVSAAGVHSGTIAGVYGDTGIFYSTDPKTVLQSFASNGGYDGNIATADNILTNNRGEAKVPITQWDAEQLIGFGLSIPAAPIIDPNGRGNAPWGMASAVAGPESGYAWAFDRGYYLANPADPNRMKNSIGVGPWKRIQYPGSQASKDVPGLKSAVIGYVGVDAATVGYTLSPASPLPPTLNWTDTTSPKSVRFSYGVLELGRPEFARVKLKILAGPGQPNSPFNANGCFTMTTDAFAGDAGGEQGGKDHVWRYYDPTTTTIDSCALVQKVFSKPLVSAGENFSFQLHIINTGNTALTNVTITDPMPVGLTYLSATPAPATTAPLKWTFASVPANSIQTLTVYVKATGTGTIFNTVTLTSDQETASYSDSVEIGAKAILNAEKSVTPSSAGPGQTVTYTLTMTNDGTGANGAPLVITENLPAGFTYGTLLTSQINGAPAASGVVTVNSTITAKPVFTISQGILPGKSLVLTFTSVISATQSAGIYGNTIQYVYEGKTIASGSLAPVTVAGGRLGDTVFRDWNGNGVKDAADEGLAGVTVQLFESDGTTLRATTTTDASGAYLFPGVPAGTFVVKTSGLPVGYTQTFDADGTASGNQSTVTIGTNGENLLQDFGYRPGGTGSIGDLVYKDIGNDGTFNGADAGIANITVKLYEDTNGNGVLDAATDALVATTSTNGSGIYSFTGLATGISYLVDVDETDADLVATFSPNTFLASTPALQAVPNLAGSYLNADFGYFENQPSSIGDTVFEDVNRDGIYTAGTDSPLGNVTVSLYRDVDSNGRYDAGTDTLVGTTVTAADGTYIFGALGPGKYVAVVDGNDADVPDQLAAAAGERAVTLSPGQNYVLADFPFVSLLNKSVNLASAVAGNSLTYTLVPSYPGDTSLAGLLVSDPIPAGTTYTSVSQNGTFINDIVNDPPLRVEWDLGSNVAGTQGIFSASGSTTTVNFPAVDDSYVDSNNVNSNFGTVTTFNSRGTGPVMRGFLKFNTSTIPAGVTITAANLSLTRTAGTNKARTLGAYRVNGAWTEGAITWANQPAFTAAPESTMSVVGNGAYTWSILSLTQAWYGGTVANNGVMIGYTTLSKDVKTFASDENGTAASRPNLAVTYVTLGGQYTRVTLASSPALVSGTTPQQVTVTMTIETVGNTATGVLTPPANLTVNNVGANTVAKLSGPTPATANVPIGGNTSTFTYVYNVTPGATPGSVSFTGKPTSGGAGFPAFPTSAQINNGTSDTTLTSPPLTFQVSVNTPPGVNVITNTATIEDAGVIPVTASNPAETATSGSIGDFVWFDADGDGVQDVGETGLSGVRVFIDQNGDGQYNVGEPTDITDTAGRYRIYGLAAGTYTVRYDYSTVPSRYIPTTALSHSATITGGQQYSLADFGLRSPASTGALGSIGDTLWLDRNEDGIVDGDETLLPNVTVRLYRDANGNGTFDATGDLLYATTTTDANGAYSFTGLPAGTYFVDADEADTDLPAGIELVSGGANLTTTRHSVVLAAGQNVTTADFGYNYAGSIGDTLFYDTNKNGVQNLGETGVPNATVVLYGDTNGNGDIDLGEPIIAVTNTNASGVYLFDNLPAGTYLVKAEEQQVVAPPSSPNAGKIGTMQGTAGTKRSVVLAAGQDYLNADIGFAEVAVVEGHVFYDANGNGVLDPGETTLPNVTVTVTGTDSLGNAVSLTGATDATGEYGFIVPEGVYTVAYNTADTDIPAALGRTTTPTSFLIAPAAGAEIENLDFGRDNTGRVGDLVWSDVDGDGIRDAGEPGISGVAVALYSDAALTVLLDSTVTDGSGAYIFNGLANGTYYVQVQSGSIPVGYNPVPTGDPDATKDGKGTATVAGGGSVLTMDFGYRPAGTVRSVSGVIFNDLNTNNTPNVPGEQLAGVSVSAAIDTNNDNIADLTFSTTTDANGAYSFLGIPDGADVIITVGTLPSPALVQTVDPDATLNGSTRIDNIAANITGVNFGYVEQLGSIAGTVVRGNGNGLADVGEPPLSGVTITLLYAGSDGILGTADDVTRVTTTNATGDYSFTGLLPGAYQITETNPANYASLADADGGNADVISTTLAVGQNKVDQDFEDAGTFVTGHLYLDSNGNNTQDIGEPNLPNVDVVITNALGGTQTVSSDANGNWSALVPPGSTTANVSEVDPQFPAGAVRTEGTDPTTVVAVLGTTVSAGNDGYLVSSTVTGHLYFDTNGNGVQNVGEPNLANVDVVVTDSNGTVQTVATNANGDWTASVPPGNTTANVSETDADFIARVPAGYTQTEGTDPTSVNAVGGATTSAGNDGYYLAAMVNGHLYFDTNGNGVQNAGEPNLANVDVLITDSTGATQTVSTNAAGNWAGSVPPGSTSANVSEADADFTAQVPAGYVQTEGTDPTTVTAVAGANTNAGNDGYYLAATVSGHLYFDTNGNGVQNPGEPNLANVDVVITNSNGTVLTVSSIANGDWSASVPPGTTTANVNEADADFIAQVPTGYTQTGGTDPTTVTAVAGANTSAGNDGYYIGTTVSGHLYFDTNGNGSQDGTEPNLANVDVVVTDVNGAIQTVSTNAAGNWSVVVPPGNTTANVSEVDADFIAQVPAGYVQTEGNDPTTVIAAVGVGTSAGNDGYYLAATVSGHLYFDTNGNGVQNPGEPNLANVDVVITNANGTPQTVSTNGNGDWMATVPPGSTTANVSETDADFIAQVPTGYTQTEGTDPTTVTAVAGANTSAGNDGYFLGTTVAGHLYFDTNGNGTQDGTEPNLVNVDVVVTDANGVVQTVSTNAGGNWTAVVAPGSTTANVSEADADFIAQVAAGYVQTEGTDPTTVTAVSGGVTSAGNDGYYLAATVTGHLYFDTNGNGMQDGAEVNLTNIDVVITNANGTTQTASTDAFGNWSASVPPGTTTANVNEADADFIAQVPTGYSQSEGTDPTTVTAVGGASTSAGNDGYFLGTTVAGHLYFDTNGNGTQDGSEPNLANVDVVVTNSNGVTTTVSTNAGGDWMLIVPPGTTVADVNELDPSFTAAVPAGYTQTEGNDPTTLVAVAGTSTSAGNDGYYLAATVTGHLYFDTNGNGVQDGAEPNLANVDVFITNANGITQTAVTNAAGNWSATVPPGATVADVNEADADFIAQVPTGYSQTEGTDPTTVTAVAGASTSAGNDGYYIGTAVSGHLYFDTNGNGTQDGTEPNLVNVEVVVTDANNVAHLVNTNASGDWTVTVPPGSTTANVNEASASFMAQVPAGYTQTEGNDPTTIMATLGAANFAGNGGYYLPATVTGHLYFDTNGNGVQNVGEPNLANVDVVVTDANGIIQTVSTNAAGNWSASVPPGTTGADVSEVDPDFGAQVPGGFSQTEGNDPTTVTAVAGVNTGAGNDGYYIGTTVTGHLYIDTNGNGVQDPAESNLANVDVVITDVNGATQTVSTNANGDWTAIVPPGSTVVDVDETDPSFTAALPLGYTRTEGTEPTTVIAVAGVSTDAGNDGYFLAATVTGHLYFDTNGNGVQDGAEPNLANVDVVVTNLNGVPQTVSTNAAGNWSASVPPGATTANVSEIDTDFTTQVPVGFSQTDGSDPTTVIAVAGATTSAGNDGYYIGTAVTGHLYFDTNGNGAQNPGEPNLVSVEVIVTDSNGVLHSVMTDAAGDWTAIVPPGAATANVNEATASFMAQVPAGYTQTQGSDPTPVVAVAGVSTSAGSDGYYLAATVSGHLYFDTNGNGAQDPGEPNLVNVGVLVLNVNGIQQTVTSGVDGNWSASVPPGTTTASVIESGGAFTSQVAAGYSQIEGSNPTTVTAVAGATTSAGNDGYYVGTTVVGHLYIDRNGNGVQDGTEPNLANVDVVVIDVNGITQVVSTNANGDWTAIVPPGSTSADVNEMDPSFTAALPVGYTRTEGTEPTTVIAAAGVSIDAGNDGYYLAATVVGHLYLDTNGNGVQDGAEPNLANVDVLITNANGTPETVSTDAAGNWTASVPPGTTIANVDEKDPQFLALVPGGFTQTEGTDPTTVTAIAGVTISAGRDGYLIPATVTGHLYVDTNGNGTQQVGEPNIANVNILVSDANGGMQTVVTDVDGNWTAIVPPGNATATVDKLDADFTAQVPTGYTQTEGTDPNTVLAVASASRSAGIDGYFIPATVTGHLYFDTNGNGVQDGTEPNLANVDVVVKDSLNVFRTVSTNGAGDWTVNVPPGDTSADVKEADLDFIAQVPVGYAQTEGTDPTSVIAVAGISTSAGNDGYYLAATVTGHLYFDTNGNGVQDGTEPNLANVDVTVKDSLNVFRTVSTNATGDWSVSVPPGNTSADVKEADLDFIAQVPLGYAQTEGTDPTSVIAVAGVSTSAGNDGYYLAATVTGHLYFDTNGNGVQDGTEPNLANVDVTVKDSLGVDRIVSTNATGDWSASVPPGNTSADVKKADLDFIAQVPLGYAQTEGTDPTSVMAVAGISTSAGNDGYYLAATVTGHLYFDTNGNGVQDGTEPNLANVDVTVKDSLGVDRIVSTNATGDWSVSVPPGNTSADVNEGDLDFIAQVPVGYAQTEGTDPTTVIAVAGVSTSAGNDGYYLAATVTGHLYFDTNGNGVQDGTEPNLANVDVTVKDSLGVDRIVSTNATGEWSASVPPGNTSADVKEADLDFIAQVPLGYAQTEGTDPTTVIAVAGVSTSAGNDGYYLAATVSGHLYFDTNGNGVQDGTELNLANVDVTVKDSLGVDRIVSTNATGDWSASVPPGNTSADVKEADLDFIAQVPVGYAQTEGTDPTSVIAVAGVSTSAGNDGYYLAATVTGHLYFDTNGNGVQDGTEPNLANVDVTVKDSLGVDRIVSTNATGDWTASVPPGNTSADVNEGDLDFIAQVPLGYAQTEGTDPTPVIAVAGISTPTDKDGYFIPATVTGHLYVDTNGNGTQQVGEPNIANVNVVITDANGAMQTVVTDANGNWTATVPPGTTSANVSELDADFIVVVPAGYTQTEGTDPTSVVAVANASMSAGIDGYFIPATVSGHLYVDTNGDGTQQVGEPNLQFVNVVITDSNNVTQTVATDATGNWTAVVPPGNTSANVDETDPDFTSIVPSTYVQKEGTDPTIVVAIANATVPGGIDGYYIPATVTGHLYVDTNGDGMQQVGEPNIANVSVLVTDANNAPQIVVTDANGNWAAMVPPGNTSADVDESDLDFTSVVPASHIRTQGTDPKSVLAVVNASTSAGIDGYFIPATMTGHLYVDTNRNGTQDVGEPNIASASVLIIDSNSDEQTVTTDIDGNWTATVPPGATSADVNEAAADFIRQVPAGYTQTEGTDPSIVNAIANDSVSAGIDGYALPPSALHLISGTVFKDSATNNDALDASDLPIANVTVTLFRDVNGDGIATPNEFVATDVTSGDGSYAFPVQPNGAYLVVETNPAGAVSDTDVDGAANGKDLVAVALAGADVSGVNFLDDGITLHSISGAVTDGAKGLPGVVLTLRNAAGDVITTSPTSGDGSYTFTNLPDGVYTVTETNPVGVTGGSDVDGGNVDVIGVEILGADALGRDFVDIIPATALRKISGSVFKDAAANNNLIDALDIPIAGVTVGLYIDITGDGIAQSGELISETSTYADGSYSFSGLPEGAYLVVETNPPGAVNDADADGAANTNDLIAVPLAGADVIERDFLDDGIVLRSISGVVTDGTNPIPGVIVTLRNAAGDIINTAVTQADGSYSFANLPDGNYTVTETNPAGTIGGSADVLNVSIAGADAVNRDFVDALAPDALHTISGSVLEDGVANNDIVDPLDAPIAGVTVGLYLDINSNGIAESTELISEIATATNGSHSFSGLPDGKYLLVETNPPGAVNDADADGAANSNDLIAVTLAGADVTGRDFLDDGIVLRSISGAVTDGTNPIPGVLITLRNLAGDIIAVIPTQADGSYTFTNLPDGSYTATETNPIGVTGGSDVDGGSADFITTTIAGADVFGRNFLDTIPLTALHKISGVIYKDAAANNDTFDPLDATIANVTVVLFRDVNGDGVPQLDERISSAVSGVHGEYSFPFLPDADYLVVAVNPLGASSDADADGTANSNDRVAVRLAGADFLARNFLKDGLVISSIGGVVSDGARGIAGVLITLFNSNGDVVGSVTTDQDGNYNFTGLPNGEYTVAESNPPGTIAGSDTDAGDPDVTLVVINGASLSAVNFFNLVPASIDPRTIYGYCTTPLMVNALRNLPPTGGTWTIVSLSKPRFGSVSIRPNGFVLYRPRANFGGRDSFIVTLTDGTSTIQKKIIIKDFTALAGTFQGLLSSGVTTRVAAPAAAEGRFTITLTDSAKFTAKLNLTGETVRIAGTLTGALRFEKNIRLRDGRTALFVLVYDDLSDTWNVTTSGDITLSSAVPIPRALKSAKPLAGRYTSAFIPDAPAGNQSSVGFGAISVAKNGAANVVGRLAGGKAFTMSARIAADGRAQYFLSGNTFTLIGAIDFTGAQASPTGNLTWSYTAADSTPANVTLDVKGSRYVAPVGKTSAIGGATPLRFELRDNAGSVLLDIASPKSPSLLVGEQSGQKVTLKLNPTNGLATGEFTDSRTAERCILYGIILQSEACVEGITDSQLDPLTAWFVDTR